MQEPIEITVRNETERGWWVPQDQWLSLIHI